MKTFNEWRKEKGLKELDTSKIDIEGLESLEELAEKHGLSKEAELTDAIAKEIEKEVFTPENVGKKCDEIVDESPELWPELLDGAILPRDMSPQQYSYACNGIVDLTLEQYQSVKGVGPKLAQTLFENGPYRDKEDIKKIKGVGPKVLEGIKQLLIPSPKIGQRSS